VRLAQLPIRGVLTTLPTRVVDGAVVVTVD
jgi:hypothetical protein